jgi:hypothetical protein
MNPPDSKPSMNPNPNPSSYHTDRGFMAGTGEPGNWKSLMTLVSWLSRSTTPTGNRSTRCLWLSLVFTRATIRLKNPGSGIPDYQVELGGSDVFGLCNSDSVSRWFSLVSPSNPTTVALAPPTNEALVASVLDDFARLHDAPDNLLSRRLWCWSASQPPTLEPLALAIS